MTLPANSCFNGQIKVQGRIALYDDDAVFDVPSLDSRKSLEVTLLGKDMIGLIVKLVRYVQAKKLMRGLRYRCGRMYAKRMRNGHGEKEGSLEEKQLSSFPSLPGPKAVQSFLAKSRIWGLSIALDDDDDDVLDVPSLDSSTDERFKN
nr:uncharacterized mitochondrial protein [Tanacetum cinerariifolium]